MKFFFDNNMSPFLAQAVTRLEEGSDRHTVTHLREKFAPNTPDAEWIRALGTERDWVIVSCDLRITKNRAEREAWRESGLSAFFLRDGWANQPLWVYSSRFLYWWPKIVSQAGMAQVGKGFLVPFGGQRFEDVPR